MTALLNAKIDRMMQLFAASQEAKGVQIEALHKGYAQQIAHATAERAAQEQEGRADNNSSSASSGSSNSSGSRGQQRDERRHKAVAEEQQEQEEEAPLAQPASAHATEAPILGLVPSPPRKDSFEHKYPFPANPLDNVNEDLIVQAETQANHIRELEERLEQHAAADAARHERKQQKAIADAARPRQEGAPSSKTPTTVASVIAPAAGSTEDQAPPGGHTAARLGTRGLFGVVKMPDQLTYADAAKPEVLRNAFFALEKVFKQQAITDEEDRLAGVLLIMDVNLTELWLSHLEERSRVDSTPPTYAMLKELLSAQFGQKGREQKAADELNMISQRPGETMSAYLLRADQLRIAAGATIKGDGLGRHYARILALGVDAAKWVCTIAEAIKRLEAGEIHTFTAMRELLITESYREPRVVAEQRMREQRASAAAIRVAALEQEDIENGKSPHRGVNQTRLQHNAAGVEGEHWCARCEKKGDHRSSDCTIHADTRKCYNCQKVGHMSRNCTEAKKPRADRDAKEGATGKKKGKYAGGGKKSHTD